MAEAHEHGLNAVTGSMAVVLPIVAAVALSLAASPDLEARIHTCRETADFLDAHIHRIEGAKTETTSSPP